MSLFLLCFIKVILYFLLCNYICYYIISYYIQVYHIMQYMLYNVYTCLIIYIQIIYTYCKSCLQMIQVPVSGTTLRASIWYWADVFSLLAGIARSCKFEAAHSQRPKSWPNSHGDVTYSLGHGQAGNKMQRYPASLLKLTFWLQTISLNQYLFPQTVWPHWGVLAVRDRAWCSVEVVSSVSGQFPVNLHTEWLLWNVHVHFDCAGSHKTMSPEVCSAIFLVNFHTTWLLWHVHVHFDCAGSHRTMSPEVSSAIFSLNFHTTLLFWHVHVHFDCAGSHKTMSPERCPRLFPCKFPHNMCISTRRLAQNGCRGIGVLHFPVYTGSCDMSFRLSTAKTPLLGACTEILARNLFWRSCSEILPRDLLQGSCHRALTEILSRALAKRPLKEILPTQLL